MSSRRCCIVASISLTVFGGWSSCGSLFPEGQTSSLADQTSVCLKNGCGCKMHSLSSVSDIYALTESTADSGFRPWCVPRCWYLLIQGFNTGLIHCPCSSRKASPDVGATLGGSDCNHESLSEDHTSLSQRSWMELDLLSAEGLYTTVRSTLLWGRWAYYQVGWSIFPLFWVFFSETTACAETEVLDLQGFLKSAELLEAWLGPGCSVTLTCCLH